MVINKTIFIFILIVNILLGPQVLGSECQVLKDSMSFILKSRVSRKYFYIFFGALKRQIKHSAYKFLNIIGKGGK